MTDGEITAELAREYAFACYICGLTLSDLSPSHNHNNSLSISPSSKNAVSSKETPLVTNVLNYLSCGHVLCRGHLGTINFFHSESQPTIRCPVCLADGINAGDSWVFWFGGHRKDQYHPAMPPAFKYGPIERDELALLYHNVLKFAHFWKKEAKRLLSERHFHENDRQGVDYTLPTPKSGNSYWRGGEDSQLRNSGAAPSPPVPDPLSDTILGTEQTHRPNIYLSAIGSADIQEQDSGLSGPNTRGHPPLLQNISPRSVVFSSHFDHTPRARPRLQTVVQTRSAVPEKDFAHQEVPPPLQLQHADQYTRPSSRQLDINHGHEISTMIDGDLTQPHSGRPLFHNPLQTPPYSLPPKRPGQHINIYAHQALASSPSIPSHQEKPSSPRPPTQQATMPPPPLPTTRARLTSILSCRPGTPRCSQQLLSNSSHTSFQQANMPPPPLPAPIPLLLTPRNHTILNQQPQSPQRHLTQQHRGFSRTQLPNAPRFAFDPSPRLDYHTHLPTDYRSSSPTRPVSSTVQVHTRSQRWQLGNSRAPSRLNIASLDRFRSPVMTAPLPLTPRGQTRQRQRIPLLPPTQPQLRFNSAPSRGAKPSTASGTKKPMQADSRAFRITKPGIVPPTLHTGVRGSALSARTAGTMGGLDDSDESLAVEKAAMRRTFEEPGQSSQNRLWSRGAVTGGKVRGRVLPLQRPSMGQERIFRL